MIDITKKQPVPNYRMDPQIYQILASAVQQKNQMYQGLGENIGGAGAHAWQKKKMGDQLRSFFESQNPPIPKTVNTPNAGGMPVASYNPNTNQTSPMTQEDPNNKRFKGMGNLPPEIMSQILPTLMKKVPEYQSVPGMVSKDGFPMSIDKFSGKYSKGDIPVTPTGYGATILPIKSDQLLESLVKDARETLIPYFQYGPGKDQAQRLDSISRIEPLIEQMSAQPGGGDARQMREAAIAFNKVLQSGVGTEGSIDALVPQTARGKTGHFIEWFTNDPTGLGQQAFIRRYADSVAREKKSISKRIEFQAEKNAPTLRILKRRDPESYQAVINSVRAQFGDQQSNQQPGGGSVQSGGLTPEEIKEFQRLDAKYGNK